MNKEIFSDKKILSDGTLSSGRKLLANISQLHTTKLGEERIRRNLSLKTEDVVSWCKAKIASSQAVITENGKNWYVHIDHCIITVNRYCYTIITAHKEKKERVLG